MIFSSNVSLFLVKSAEMRGILILGLSLVPGSFTGELSLLHRIQLIYFIFNLFLMNSCIFSFTCAIIHDIQRSTMIYQGFQRELYACWFSYKVLVDSGRPLADVQIINVKIWLRSLGRENRVHDFKVPMKRKFLFYVFVDKGLKIGFLSSKRNIAPFHNTNISVKHNKSYATNFTRS